MSGGASSAGRYANSGSGPALLPLDIGHADYMALIDPDTAFWALVRKERLAEALAAGPLLDSYRKKRRRFRTRTARAALRTQAVGRLFQPDRALQPELHLLLHSRRHAPQGGEHMPADELLDALDRLKTYFAATMPAGPPAADHLPRRRAAAEPRGGLRRHRRLRRRLPLRRPDQRHAAGRRGASTSSARATSASAFRSTGRWRRSPTARADLGRRGVYDKVLDAMDALRGYPTAGA